MASDIGAIAQHFADLVAAVPGVKSALNYIPEELPSLPAVTMGFSRLSQLENETGPHTQNLWTWDVEIVIPFGGRVAGSDMQQALSTLYALLPPILAVARQHPDLDGLCIKATLGDAGDRPVYDPDEKTLTKGLELTVRTEEV